ncbi:MAG: NFACT RNA binding domain-containing protein [bacterium]
MNHLLLHLFVRDTAAVIRGKRIGAVRYLPPFLSIELTGGVSSLYLVVILSNPGPFVYPTNDNPLPGLGTEVFKRIVGMPVDTCEQLEDDRLIALRLAGGREPAAVVIRLFGAAGKARILGPESIIESLDPREAGRPRPRSSTPRRPSLAAVDAAALRAALGPDAADTCDRAVPGLTPELLDCFRRAPDEGGEVDIPTLLSWRDDLLGRRRGFHLGTSGRLGGAGPLPDPPPPGLPVCMGPFERADEACRWLGEFILTSMRDDVIALHAAPLERRLDRRRRLAEELESNLRSAESFEVWRKEANVLAAFQSRITPGSSRVTLPDPYETDEEITIELDPAVPLREQISRRFKRAAKLERSLDGIDHRLRTIRADIQSLEEALDRAARQATLAGALGDIRKLLAHYRLEPRSSPAPRDARETKSYRRFDIDKMWFVLVGRNNRENDEITFRAAAPDDTWLHADQVPGSHVVLKSHGAAGNPPMPVIEAAAGIAAYFSKARHASLVPVIYTLRKYVRKFRGAHVGQVKCEREKTVMVKPALPRGGQQGHERA